MKHSKNIPHAYFGPFLDEFDPLLCMMIWEFQVEILIGPILVMMTQ